MAKTEEQIPMEVEISPTFTLPLSPPSTSHWAIELDVDFKTHLQSKKTECEETKTRSKEKTKTKPAPQGSGKAGPAKRTSQGPTPKTGGTTSSCSRSTTDKGNKEENSESSVSCLMEDAKILGDVKMMRI